MVSSHEAWRGCEGSESKVSSFCRAVRNSKDQVRTLKCSQANLHRIEPHPLGTETCRFLARRALPSHPYHPPNIPRSQPHPSKSAVHNTPFHPPSSILDHQPPSSLLPLFPNSRFPRPMPLRIQPELHTLALKSILPLFHLSLPYLSACLPACLPSTPSLHIQHSDFRSSKLARSFFPPYYCRSPSSTTD